MNPSRTENDLRKCVLFYSLTNKIHKGGVREKICSYVYCLLSGRGTLTDTGIPHRSSLDFT
jgi:hypothetical protein